MNDGRQMGRDLRFSIADLRLRIEIAIPAFAGTGFAALLAMTRRLGSKVVEKALAFIADFRHTFNG